MTSPAPSDAATTGSASGKGYLPCFWCVRVDAGVERGVDN
jgi:hypothetical protein